MDKIDLADPARIVADGLNVAAETIRAHGRDQRRLLELSWRKALESREDEEADDVDGEDLQLQIDEEDLADDDEDCDTSSQEYGTEDNDVRPLDTPRAELQRPNVLSAHGDPLEDDWLHRWIGGSLGKSTLQVE